jgi:uncharacterized protein (TIGR02145 family)
MFSLNAISQAPNSFKYQSMIRKTDGSPLANQSVKLKISILRDNASGTSVYSEIHSTFSNAFGVINVNIGEGSEKSGSIAAIDWSAGLYFVKVEMDETGGTNYTLSSVGQLLSVPYALQAKSVDSINWATVKNKPSLVSSIFISNPQAGDLIYYDGSNWNKIPRGKNNQVLTLVDGKPQWNNIFPLPLAITDAAYPYNYSTTAVFGRVNANGQIISIKFKYGTTSDCENTINASPLISKGFDTTEITATINGLLENTVYYYKIAAISNTDTLYGNIKSFKTSLQANSMSDIDGNIYQTVAIGEQIWMAENLKTKKFRNGDAIPTTNTLLKDSVIVTNPIYHWVFGGDVNNFNTYGCLYTWYAVNDARHLCPSGWHVPSDAEWAQLSNYLGGDAAAGGKLKETGTSHWKAPNTGATDEYGFRMLPGGWRHVDDFWNLGAYGYYWSSTSNDTTTAWLRIASMYDSKLLRTFPSFDKTNGFSVRCIKD